MLTQIQFAFFILFKSKEFVALVVLASFLAVPDWTLQNVDVLDLFSGKARLSKIGRFLGYTAVAYDLSYHPVSSNRKRKRGRKPRSCMDWNGEAGFV